MRKGFINEISKQAMLFYEERLEDFVHGNCQYFALALALKFNYKIVLWLETDENIGKDVLIHAFNIYKTDDKKKYIDARGVVDRPADIESGFDYLDRPDFLVVSIKEAITVLRSMGIDCCNKKLLDDAMRVIDDNPRKYAI